MSIYTPGTYAKGDDVRVANTSRDAVALAFEGFKLVADAPVVEESAPVVVETVVEKPKDDKPTPAPSPTELARKKSQEDNKS